MKIMGKVKIRRHSFQAHIHTIVPPETVYFFFFFNSIVFISFIEYNLREKISEKIMFWKIQNIIWILEFGDCQSDKFLKYIDDDIDV